MASAPPSALAASDEAAEIRRRALRRLVIAVLMLTAAFGALLAYEQLKSPRMITPAAKPSPTATLPVTKRLIEPAPDAAPASETTAPAPSATAAAEVSNAPPPPPPPEVINTEPPTSKAGPAPRFAPTRPETSVSKVASTTVPPPAAAAAPGTAAAPAAALRQAPSPPQPGAASPAAKTDASRTYVVQLGVFTSPQNAEALQRKLTEGGVSTFTETRVLIGPFRDRAEADRSMEIVKKLGLGAVVMPARP